MATIGIAYSTLDPAGKGMASYLEKMLREAPIKGIVLRGFEESVLFFDFLEHRLPSDFYIVLSKHKSESGIPSLTVHHTGNLTGNNTYGGRPYEISWSFPRMTTHLLRVLWNNALKTGIVDKYEIAYEATHHGPTSLSKPIIFYEIGSTPDEWRNSRIQEFMAMTLHRALTLYKDMGLPACTRSIGFGGGHYARRFTRLALEKEFCFGHIVPKYILKEGIDGRVLEQLFVKNYEGITTVVFEKKSAKKQIRETIKQESIDRGFEFMFI